MEENLKFLAKNDAGDIVFNIELKSVGSNSKSKINCSIGIDYESNPGVKDLMEKLLSEKTKPESRAIMIQEILSSIKTMEPVIESVRKSGMPVPAEVLDPTERVLVFVTAVDENGEFESIPVPRNRFYFHDVVNMLAGCVLNLEKIERSDFEEIIAGNSDIEEQYVEFYSSEASFLTTAMAQGDKCYRFFIMRPNPS